MDDLIKLIITTAIVTLIISTLGGLLRFAFKTNTSDEQIQQKSLSFYEFFATLLAIIFAYTLVPTVTQYYQINQQGIMLNYIEIPSGISLTVIFIIPIVSILFITIFKIAYVVIIRKRFPIELFAFIGILACLLVVLTRAIVFSYVDMIVKAQTSDLVPLTLSHLDDNAINLALSMQANMQHLYLIAVTSLVIITGFVFKESFDFRGRITIDTIFVSKIMLAFSFFLSLIIANYPDFYLTPPTQLTAWKDMTILSGNPELVSITANIFVMLILVYLILLANKKMDLFSTVILVAATFTTGYEIVGIFLFPSGYPLFDDPLFELSNLFLSILFLLIVIKPNHRTPIPTPSA